MAHNIDRASVHLMRYTCASIHMVQQGKLLAKFCAIAKQSPPIASLLHVKWDEAAINCFADIDNSGNKVKSSWSVLVVRCRIGIIWPDGRQMLLRVTMPPVILVGKGAEHCHYAIRYHPCSSLVNGLVDLLSTRSQEFIRINEADGAASNERLIAFWENLYSSDMSLDCRCQSHATALIVLSLITFVNKDLFNRLYALMTFLKNSSNFTRLLQSVEEALKPVEWDTILPHCNGLVSYLIRITYKLN